LNTLETEILGVPFYQFVKKKEEKKKGMKTPNHTEKKEKRYENT